MNEAAINLTIIIGALNIKILNGEIWKGFEPQDYVSQDMCLGSWVSMDYLGSLWNDCFIL